MSCMPGIIVHAGAGENLELTPTWKDFAEQGRDLLQTEAEALWLAAHIVFRMEEHGGVNAGIGAVLRLDGRTIEMDAVAADSTGKLGAIGAVSGVRNPVLLALELIATPHTFMVGPGAAALAKRRNLPCHPGPSQRAWGRYGAIVKAVRDGRLQEIAHQWDDPRNLERFWNFERSLEESLFEPSDTVGAVALDKNGVFAVASSTGGSSLMLRGRVGDVPIQDCGFCVGEHGAVAATGYGEEIIRRRGSLQVYQRLEQGCSPQEACEWGVSRFPTEFSVGFIAISRDGTGVACNRDLPSHAIFEP